MKNLRKLKPEEAKTLLQDGKKIQVIDSDILKPHINKDPRVVVPVDEAILELDLKNAPPMYVAQYMDKNGTKIGTPHRRQCPDQFENCLIEN